jgi:starch-binding outer membrane protein, SusD/RagB family
MKRNIILKFSAMLMCIIFSGCGEQFLEPTLSTSKDVNTSVKTYEDLRGLLIGALDRMNGSTYYGRDYVIYGEVRSDNAFSTGNSGRFVTTGQFFQVSTDGYASDTWTTMYQTIANLNIIINSTIPDAGDGAVDYVKGQAYMLRGLVYMDLVRLYGQQQSPGDLGVPIITKFNDGNIYPNRATLTETWAQVTSDLEMAETLMDPALDGDTNTEPTYWAALALQSRAYLYTKEWAKARDAAKAVIDGGQYALTANSWSPNGSSDNMFTLGYLATDHLGNSSLYFILQATVYGDIVATQNLYNAYDVSDVRRTLFTGVGTNKVRTSKYNASSYLDAVRVIRYAEVLLNYAEALTQLSDAGALAALNVIPVQRGATPYASATVDNVLAERRKELAFEGQRFFDLMRYEKNIVRVDPGQTFGDAGLPFGDYRLSFPIPQVETDANPNAEQNDGY